MIFGAISKGVKRLFGSGNNPKRRKFASIAYDSKRPDVVDGYRKIDEDEDQVAYRDDAGNVKIGIRGTSNLNDVMTDVNAVSYTHLTLPTKRIV